jgi:hypothetical protein
MAIIQISKIQQRTGNLVDLPQLDEAEFGWATDTKRLFIGKSTPNENIEVLTSYSNISFSQVTGSDGGNLNINNAQTGQFLTYVSSTDTWQNSGGNSLQPGNSALYTTNDIHLGNVGNVKLGGGAIGYVLQTDGTGNLTWSSKGTITANIIALSNATPIVMRVATSIPYTNGTSVTISGVNGAANSNVNSKIFYVKVATDFPTSGNVSLYTDSTLLTAAVGTSLTYTNSPNALAITSVGGGGAAAANGSTYSVQFNNSGILSGDSNITWDFNNRIFSVNGNANVTGNVNVTANVVASRLVSNIATGTSPLVVTSTTQVANLNSAFLNGFNWAIPAGVGTTTPNSGAFTTIAGSLTTAAQPNITSVGTLTSVSVSGNANVGNLGTSGLVYALGNVTGGNIVTNGIMWSAGNATHGNISSAGLITATGNIIGGNINTGGLITATGNITSSAFLVGANLSITGNANVGNLGTAGQVTATGNGTFGNIITGGILSVTGTITGGNLATAGTLSVGGNANVGNLGTAGLITATGNIQSTAFLVGANLSITGNANVGNLGTAGLITATGNIGGGNINTAGQLVSSVATGTAPLVVTSTTRVSNLNVAYANVADFINVTTGTTGIVYPIFANAVTGNITETANTIFSANMANGALIATTFSGIHSGNILTTDISTGANTTVGNITGNWILTAGSRMQATYADLAEYYEADAVYEPGTVLEFGGEKEVTIAEDGTTRVAGVVTTNPAYVMNSTCPGIAAAIALQGRVPCKVRGKVRKGDMMVSGGNGFARPWNNPQMGMVIGKALENFEGIEGVIEVAVGRL